MEFTCKLARRAWTATWRLDGCWLKAPNKFRKTGELDLGVRQGLIERPILSSSLATIKTLKSDTGPGTTMAESAKRLLQKYYVLMNSLIKAEIRSRNIALFLLILVHLTQYFIN